MREHKPCRITWGGLMRVLHQDRRGTNFTHEHIRLVHPDGHRDFLNVKYDAMGYPYFVIVRDNRRY